MSGRVEILVVDDRSENLLAIESILSSPNYNLVSATSGTEALRHVLDRDFAVILADVMMPGMDGFELVTMIKQRERSRYTPIIFLTAFWPDINFIYRGYSVGAVDYLTKPFDPDVLRAKVAIFVELFLKNRRLHEQAQALRAAERRERELELEAVRVASERRYLNLAEAIPQIVWTATPDGSITYFNQRWFEYTGQAFEAAKRRGWMSMVHPNDAELCAKTWSAGVASRQQFQLECRLRSRNGGSYRWHSCRALPELDVDHRIVGWLGTYTDFDDLKRACEAAEQSVHVRDEFLSIASHELRTPLTTLQLRLQSLTGDLHAVPPPAVDSRIHRKLDSAVRQGARLISLVDSLLDVSRITSGSLALRPELFDLVEAAQELVDRLAETASMAGVVLELHSSGPTHGFWDRLRIEQILLNLITNAIKYAPNAPVEVTIEAPANKATITVRDHGPGIVAADRERIFGPFERAVSSRNYGGLGLGLYIAHQNALAHGGSITVVSEPGAGAAFTLELPLAASTNG
jgi:PAS domain S-box-containing protein